MSILFLYVHVQKSTKFQTCMSTLYFPPALGSKTSLILYIVHVKENGERNQMTL